MKRKLIRGTYKLMFFPNLFILKSTDVLLDEWVWEQANRKQEYLEKLKKLRCEPNTREQNGVVIPLEMLDYVDYIKEKTHGIKDICAYYNTPQSKQELLVKVLWAIKHARYEDRLAYFDDVKQNGINSSVYSFYHTNNVTKRYSFFRIEQGKILEDYVDENGYLYTRIHEITSIKWCYERFGFHIKTLTTVININ